MSLESVSLKQVKDRMNESKQQIVSTLESLDGAFTLLEETMGIEKNFLKTLSDSQEFLKHIKWVYDINDFKKHVANLVTEIAESKKMYVQLEKGITLQNADQLLTQITGVRDGILKIDRGIKDAETQVNEAWRDYLEETKVFVDDLKSFLDLLAKKKIKISQKPVQERLDKLEGIIDIKDVRGLSYRLSELEEIKDETRKDFYKAIEPVLKETEVKVLQLIMSKTKAERRPWLSNTELRQIVQKQLKIEPKSLDEIVQKLIREGFLKPGISLMF
jgi:hypothetical protein